MNPIDRALLAITRSRGLLPEAERPVAVNKPRRFGPRSQRSYTLGPEVVLASDTMLGHDSGTFSPEKYGEYIATSNPVYSCVTLRAELLSSLPLRIYKGQGKNKKEVTSGPLYDLLHLVNPQWTMRRLVYMTECSLCLWGVNFWALERGTSGKQSPREIWWAVPHRMRVVPDEVNYVKEFVYIPATAAPVIHYDMGEIIWMQNPNPVDEFSGLSNLAAARLAADLSSAAMQSNMNIFRNGSQLGGVVAPSKASGVNLTPEQAKGLSEMLARKFSGAANAHKWWVSQFDVSLQPAGISPKDAEFPFALQWALADVARAHKVPQDLIGGQRTYENVRAAMMAVYTHCVIPEGAFVAGELTEKLLPMFPGQGDYVEFDSSQVEVLQEDRSEIITQMNELWSMGVPLNVLLQEFMPHLLPLDGQGYPWGNVWWAPMNVAPISSASAPVPPPAPAAGPPSPAAGAGGGTGAEAGKQEQQPARARARKYLRAIEYGGAEHERLWRSFAARTEAQEKRLGGAVADLLRRQKSSVLSRLRGRTRSASDIAGDPFDRAQWTKTFRVEMRPEIEWVIRETGEAALADLAVGIAFDVLDPDVVRFLEQRAQRFARQVNETTWTALQESLAVGVEAGEDISQLAARVETVMGERIASSGEVIARTEVIGASNGGTLLSWEQSDVVEGKTWLAALDHRTRETHSEAHGQTVALDEDFQVGAGSGPAPGQIGIAEEDIQCRCTMTAVVKQRTFGANGHRREVMA